MGTGKRVGSGRPQLRALAHRVPGPDPGPATAKAARTPGPATGGRPLLDAARHACALLHRALLVARWARPQQGGRGLRCSAPLSDSPRLSVAVKPAKSQLPATLHPTEPGRDSGRPRPLGQLRRPHHGGTHRGNASGLTPEPPEGVPRRGAGPAQRGLRSVAAASLGVGTSG